MPERERELEGRNQATPRRRSHTDPASDPEVLQTSPRWPGHKEMEREKQGGRWRGRSRERDGREGPNRATHPQMPV